MIKNVVFDFGGVLVFWEPLDFYKKIFKDEAEAIDFVNFMMPYNLLLDAGINKRVMLDALKAKYIKWSNCIEMWETNWEDFFTYENMAVVNLIKRMHAKGIPLYGITNWQEDKEYYLHNNLHFMGYLKDVIVSGKEKLVKPDIRIYNKLAERHNLIGKETLFIDDVKDNVVGAQNAGWQAHHFTDSEKLETILLDNELI